MRILLSGATGFLGGHLLRRLHQDGHSVIALGRNKTRLAELAGLADACLLHDLADGIPDGVPSVDAVIHAAALSSPWGSRAAFQRANVTGTETMIALARQCSARRFVLISSPSVYFKFADQHALAEASPLPPPVNAYAATKRQAEKLVEAATDLDPVILRPRGLYGRGDTSLLPRLLKAARNGPLPLMRDGKAATDLTHVEDVVSAVLAALDAPSSLPQRVFNISGGQALKIRDVAEAAALRSGISPRWRRLPVTPVLAAARLAEWSCRLAPGQPEPPVTAYGVGLFAYHQTLDLTAARTWLGWNPQIDFETGLALTFSQEAA
ncbi:NAD-dependent epimerase/dehydratase family protein [Maricaulis parjimensis]|uniref:NAD-dependent epimerase/dehydratase family protein n=1 Tax=Maricaulis parjimensis TaxID=144023 RepID=UPI00193A4D9B|nr:NAD(P)-dependent oxidoreductase [Maricaulis parjimensis]